MSLETTLEALESKAQGSLSKQAKDTLKLVRAAQDLLPGNEPPEAPLIVIEAIPYRTIPEDLLPEDWEGSQEGPKVQPTRKPPVKTPVAPKAFIPEMDPEVSDCLADLGDRLGVYLDDPVIQWSDLRGVLREVIRELSGLTIPEPIPPLVIIPG